MNGTFPRGSVMVAGSKVRNAARAEALEAEAAELLAARAHIAELTARLQAAEAELDSLRVTLQVRDLLLPQAAPEYVARRELVVDAGAPLAAEQGFHTLERDGNGTVFRWSGPEPRFHYDLHLDRTRPLAFALAVPQWGAQHAQGLLAHADGQTLALDSRPAGRRVLFEGVLPAREALGLTRLAFQVRAVHPAKSKVDGSVSRWIGVPVLRLRIGPVPADASADALAAAAAAG